MDYTYSIPQSYYDFLKNISNRKKIELINWLSNSMLENKKENPDDFFDCFGAFISDKTAEKQVEEIRNSRNFSIKNI